MYSPGSLNVAFTTVLPLFARSIVGFTLSNFTSPGPRNFVHVTAMAGGGVNPSGAAPAAAPRPPRAAPRPGAAAVVPVAPVAPIAPAPPAAPAAGSPPRAPRPRPALGSGTVIFAPSSAIHSVSGTGTPTVPVNFAAIVLGGPVNTGPFGSNLNVGGVFLFAASSKGSTM